MAPMGSLAVEEDGMRGVEEEGEEVWGVRAGLGVWVGVEAVWWEEVPLLL